jgi:hypothetical protein
MSHNLRKSAVYRSRRVRVNHTRSRQISIGERRKPDSKGKPGFLRLDTVHQGQKDGQEGVYSINSVDTVTQWQNIGCVETISEQHMIPVLEALLHQFPFCILGFHCDNGSEFLNHRVADMLNKLLIEFTKSRAYRTTDNCAGGRQERIRGTQTNRLWIHRLPTCRTVAKFLHGAVPYLNFHRPCGFAVLVKGARGRIQRRYPADGYRTPFEKLCSLKNWQQYLKPGTSAASLRAKAMKRGDMEAAKLMQQAKLGILQRVRLHV